VPSDRNVELLGANEEGVTVQASAASQVRLDPSMRQKAAARLPAPDASGSGASTSDRVFLNLENVRGQSDASAFRVYVGVPYGEDPAAHPDRLAGTISPFGMRKASQPDSEHAGQGLTYVLDITKIASQLHAAGSFDVDHVPVQIVPVRQLPDEQKVSIGRISVFRQGT
jgi:tyrosinase